MLNNRRALESFIERTKFKEDSEVSIIMIDINGFKKINDTLGHKAGDQILIQAANILKEAFKNKNYFLSRYGGDEFVVIDTQSNNEISFVKKEIERLCDELNKDNKGIYSISFSVGEAVVNKDYMMDSFDAAILQADRDMYANKKKYHLKRDKIDHKELMSDN